MFFFSQKMLYLCTIIKGLGLFYGEHQKIISLEIHYMFYEFSHSMLCNHWTTSTLCLTHTIFDPRTLNISLHLEKLS